MPTAKSSCVVSALSTRPSAVVTQFTISCAAELLRLVTSDDLMTSLLKKLSVSIKIHLVKLLWSPFGQFPNLSTESVDSRREIVAKILFTPPTLTRLNSAVASRRRCMY